MGDSVTVSTVRAVGLVTSLLSQDDDHVTVTSDYLSEVSSNDPALCLGLANLSRLLAVLAAKNTDHTPEQVLQSISLQLQQRRP